MHSDVFGQQPAKDWSQPEKPTPEKLKVCHLTVTFFDFSNNLVLLQSFWRTCVIYSGSTRQLDYILWSICSVVGFSGSFFTSGLGDWGSWSWFDLTWPGCSWPISLKAPCQSSFLCFHGNVRRCSAVPWQQQILCNQIWAPCCAHTCVCVFIVIQVCS